MLTNDPTPPGLLTLEGEGYAHAYLARVRLRQATAHDLEQLVQFLDGPVLEGFCAVLQAALLHPGSPMEAPHA